MSTSVWLLFFSFGMGFTLVISIVEIVLVLSVSRVVFKLNTKKAISLFSDLFTKSDTNPGNTYTPRPIYRSFED